MSSPLEKDGTPGRELSFVFGNSVDNKPQKPYLLPEDTGPPELAECYSTETLCLSRTMLKHVTESILENSSLKHLYLEGNHISSIPDFLFFRLPNLQWLDLRNNQIVSLPAEIGMHRSLRTLLLEGNPISELPPELELPEVEKLQLSELMGSSMEEEEESVDEDEDELQKFKELKEKMILLDKAELGLVARRDRSPKLYIRKKATTKAGIIPELCLFDTLNWKRPEERRQAAVKELKERQSLLEQRKKSQEALQKWRTQTRIIQQKKMSAHKQKQDERQRKPKEVEADSTLDVQNSSSPQRQILSMPIKEHEETRFVRELQRQICARVENMHERYRNPRGTTSEQMAATEQDVEEMRNLQRRLLERKRNVGRDSGKSFTIFTGDTWPCFLDK
ncbi:Leucine-rich repeat-containing protein 27 [Channa argus]|uniref:Leucine-rich repeat-containing protein 27 n=1 Tax=Channa argus TaxID=215402 RepID=A0A6G1R1M1_CHAAH|nr:Leucine-rich repeat-containing protein 27 [Channa argus]